MSAVIQEVVDFDSDTKNALLHNVSLWPLRDHNLWSRNWTQNVYKVGNFNFGYFFVGAKS